MKSTTIKDILQFARSKGACSEAIAWLKTQDDSETAWQACERPDWMIWLAARRGIDHRIIVRLACECARTALRFVPEGEERPRLAIEAAERWIVGEATREEVRAAAAAAAAAAAYADAAADAAAAAAAAAAAYADAYATYADARREANIKMCDIVRKHISLSDLFREDA